MNNIHKTAIISRNATIGENVTVGAYAIIDDNVKIASNNVVYPHVYITGNTEIEEGNKFFPFSSIGSMPQDLKYRGENSRLYIGKNNTFREHCTLNPGTEGDDMNTIIGNSSLFMVGVHIAHDCVIGNEVIFANQATLGGHVHVHDKAVIGGLSAVHQFCKIGKLAMVGGMSAVENDVIPYSLAIGNRAKITGINIVGLKRAQFSNDQIREYSKTVDLLFTGKSISEQKTKIKDDKSPLIIDLVNFLDIESNRGLCRYEK